MRSWWLAVPLVLACDPMMVEVDAAGDPADAGTDAGPEDAGLPWTGPGCDPVDGIECDGDWADRCRGLCDASECCSPLGGRFACAPRGADGSCPAANIWVDESRIEGGQIAVEWRFFADDDCAIIERCVDAPGWRRLLHFGTWTPNTGDADLYLGPPADDVPYFVYSACHDHHHFEGYAEYELRDESGAVAARGHKQAFCLLDFYRYPGTEETGLRYDCEDQGIQAGFQDVYDAGLDCQWVDVTDVAPGDYTLHIELNTNRTLLESDYDDNVADVMVSVPPESATDITMACSFLRGGPDRDCGLTRDDAYTCTPGETVTVGCSSACGLGTCSGDTVLRICPTSGDPDCGGMLTIDSNDDSGCNADDVCSQVIFTCPADGGFVVFSGAYDSDGTATCNVAVMATP